MRKFRITDKTSGKVYRISWEGDNDPSKEDIRNLVDLEKQRQSPQEPLSIPDPANIEIPESINPPIVGGLVEAGSYIPDVGQGIMNAIGIPTSGEEISDQFSPTNILKRVVDPFGTTDYISNIKDRAPEILGSDQDYTEKLARLASVLIPGLAPAEKAGELIGTGFGESDPHKILEGVVTGALTAEGGRQIGKSFRPTVKSKVVDPVDIEVDRVMNEPAI